MKIFVDSILHPTVYDSFKKINKFSGYHMSRINSFLNFISFLRIINNCVLMNLNYILHIGCYRSNDESWKELHTNLHEKIGWLKRMKFSFSRKLSLKIYQICLNLTNSRPDRKD